MKLRCPYCKTIIESVPSHGRCPKCGKVMKIPVKLQNKSARERKRIKQKIIREGERKLQEFAVNSDNPLRKPAITIMILAVMAFIGALLVSRSNHIKMPTKPPEEQTILELRALYIANKRFFNDCARYPTAQEGLNALINNPGILSWGGPYVNLIKPDQWHHPYNYIVSNNTFKVFSSGPDGIPGTADDLYPYQKEDITQTNTTFSP